MAAFKLVKSDDVIWNIGANIGLAAAVRSGKRGKAISFEHDVWLVELVRPTSAAQPAKNAPIGVVPVAVAPEVSLRGFSIAAELEVLRNQSRMLIKCDQ